MSEIYDADYYINGRQSGKSLYTDYRWMGSLTRPMCEAIVKHCGIEKGHSILDFGCARGYVVRAFRELGYKAWGIDISKWATDNCDETVKEYVQLLDEPHDAFDWIIAKDVLEHIPTPALEATIAKLLMRARVGVFVVVPLAEMFDRESPFSQPIPTKVLRYVVPEYEKDITHCQRMNLLEWAHKFHEASLDFSLRLSHVVPGVKQNYAQYARGNGFIVAYRHSTSNP